ncbi:hypothetical protein GQ44DRAFT_741739 [Phaeosphaeriaceae sp. PMI808]|nr:hypothetical protein GQ44DRAFT_741739 [Phaeosphaeriaceae sp. PMI808]
MEDDLDPDTPELLSTEEPVVLCREPLSFAQVRFSRAWDTCLQLHEIFRTAFVAENAHGEPVQEIMSFARSYLRFRQVANKEAALEAYKKLESEEYNLGAGETTKFTLFRWDKDSSPLVYDYHRLVGVGSTTENIFTESAQLYAGSELPSLTRVDLENAYWTSLDAEIPSILLVLPLPEAKPENRYGPPWKQHTASTRISLMVARRVRERSRLYKATAMQFYLAAFRVLLARASKSTDIGIGLADTNRASNIDEMSAMGFLANTLPLHISSYSPKMPFSEELASVKDSVTKAMLHSGAPYGVILDHLSLSNFEPQRESNTETGTIGEARIVDTLVSREAIQYDILLEISDDPTKNPLTTPKAQSSFYGPTDSEALLRDTYWLSRHSL